MVEIDGKGDTRNTKGRYENHIKPILGNELMEEITTEDIKKFVTAKKKKCLLRQVDYTHLKQLMIW